MQEVWVGGGLSLREFQLVDCKFSKCMFIVSSSIYSSISSPSYIGKGSLIKISAKCLASRSLIPGHSFLILSNNS
jgi:hypothetical protein